jgi:DNA-binding transcriptional regulator YdaS (Cro superfamily)
MEALDEAIEIAGSAVALARGIGASTSAPGMWKQRGRETGAPVPADWCPSIERFTKSKGRPVMCERLNPTVEWYVLRATDVIANGAEL